MIILKMESIKQVKGRNYWCMQNWWILKIILGQRSLNKREISQVYDFINIKLYKQKLPNIVTEIKSYMKYELWYVGNCNVYEWSS